VFARFGARIAIWSAIRDGAHTADEIARAGGEALALATDVRDRTRSSGRSARSRSASAASTCS
jgi:hypothetical protein